MPSDPQEPSIYVTYTKPGPTAVVLSVLGLPIPSSVESKLSWTYFDRDFDGYWDLRTAPGDPISHFEVLDVDSWIRVTPQDDSFNEICLFVSFAITGDGSFYQQEVQVRAIVQELRQMSETADSADCKSAFDQCLEDLLSDQSNSAETLANVERRLADLNSLCFHREPLSWSLK